ncbi:hypothetical protein chiPu_0027254, partial [Chiloscyllium punctatum]|nr:hypothetical protein [Chiloscyllium punctatum]
MERAGCREARLQEKAKREEPALPGTGSQTSERTAEESVRHVIGASPSV